jgi:hypothetical protein
MLLTFLNIRQKRSRNYETLQHAIVNRVTMLLRSRLVRGFT